MPAPDVRYQHLAWKAIAAEAPAPGIERRMIVGDGLMICRLRFDPFVVTPVHRHPHEQMTVVERGRVRFTIAGEQRIAGPGEVLHFPSNVEHGATMLEEEVVLLDVFTPIREDFLAPRRP
jgi:quercetin dioxygenase-like cupin family protein